MSSASGNMEKGLEALAFQCESELLCRSCSIVKEWVTDAELVPRRPVGFFLLSLWGGTAALHAPLLCFAFALSCRAGACHAVPCLACLACLAFWSGELVLPRAPRKLASCGSQG